MCNAIYSRAFPEFQSATILTPKLQSDRAIEASPDASQLGSTNHDNGKRSPVRLLCFRRGRNHNGPNRPIRINGHDKCKQCSALHRDNVRHGARTYHTPALDSFALNQRGIDMYSHARKIAQSFVSLTSAANFAASAINNLTGIQLIIICFAALFALAVASAVMASFTE